MSRLWAKKSRFHYTTITPRFAWETFHEDNGASTFDEARVALNHPLARRCPDTGHSDSEERSIVMGFSPTGHLLLIVTSPDSDGNMRIISARRATKRERHAYEDE